MNTPDSEISRLRSRRNHYARRCERLEAENGMLRNLYKRSTTAYRKLKESTTEAYNGLKSKFNAAVGVSLCSLAGIVFVIGSQMAVLNQPRQPVQYSAQTFDYTSPARVLASVRIGQNGGCSGTIIHVNGDRAYGVSAAHCCSGVGREFVIGNPDGTSAGARWMAINRQHDLAIFVTYSEHILAACPVAEKAPQQYTAVDACGYPSGHGPIYKRVTYRGDNRINGGMVRATFAVNEGLFAGGDSGGGVFAGGRLVGVMTHGGGGMYAATHEQLIGFLNRELGQSGFS